MTPLRVLHVITKLDRAGTETWLVEVLRRIDRRSVAFDFAVNSEEPGDYDAEVTSLGARIFHCPFPRRPLRYIPRLLSVLHTIPRYDIIHSHVEYYSGIIVATGALAGIPRRIVHTHADASRQFRNRPLWRAAYRRLMLAAMRAWATELLATSSAAATSTFDRQLWTNKNGRVVYCGVAAEPARYALPSKRDLRTSLGIPTNAWVVGHVGRFHWAKNHSFLLEVARISVTNDESVHFLFVGDGPGRQMAQRLARERGSTPTSTSRE